MISPDSHFSRTLGLLVRNEGKIKSYDSCRDLRAWSHDERKRCCYLRDWMKTDVPICVMPVRAFAGFMKAMTYRTRGKLTPRCHPDCKSKVLVDSITNSCHAIKDCFKIDHQFEQYFVEEDFETSHWPCERCLEALKSIKMFWKVIIEKIFRLKIQPENTKKCCEPCHRSNNIRDIARSWQKELVHEAYFVKTFLPSIMKCKCPKEDIVSTISDKGEHKDETPTCVSGVCNARRHSCFPHVCGTTSSHSNNTSKTTISCKSHRHKVTICDKVGYSCNPLHTKSTYVKVRTKETGCDPCINSNEVTAFKVNIANLNNNYGIQKSEIDHLKKENKCLKFELESIPNSSKRKAAYFCPNSNDFDVHKNPFVLKPFESVMEDELCAAQTKDINSQMIITMENSKNEKYRHISLLKVLHKTNDPTRPELNFKEFRDKDDPIQLLTKVQKTLDSIVRREMDFASGRRKTGRDCEIKASYRNLDPSRCVPSHASVLRN